MPVRAHDHELAVGCEYGGEILKPNFFLVANGWTLAVLDIAQIIDNDEIVMSGDDVAGRADGGDGGLAIGFGAGIEHDGLSLCGAWFERFDMEDLLIECDEFLVPEILLHDLGQEGLGVSRGGVHDEDPELGLPEQAPDGIGLGEDGGLKGMAWLEPERAFMPFVQLPAPGVVWNLFQLGVIENLAGEVEEVTPTELSG